MRLAIVIVLLLIAGGALVGPSFAPQLHSLWQKLRPAAGAIVMSAVACALGLGIAVGLGAAFIGWPS